MSRTLAFIQARMSSSRFPGKVLEPIAGTPAIVYMVRRVQRAQRLAATVVLTSTHASDDPLGEALHRAGIECFRGDLDDVLRRFADAALAHAADVVVRLTGDCPLIDPWVIDAVVDARQQSGVDYASNVDPPTYPDGLDVECFTADALRRADAGARTPAEREHVTLWMRSEAAGLMRINQRAVADFSSLRLTVDHPDDLQAVRALVDLLPQGGEFDLFDILRTLSAHPRVTEINRHGRNEGLVK
jgi:spore coat polysaccharide biosynthesis protein SpsF (cytidylyltransferase family)